MLRLLQSSKDPYGASGSGSSSSFKGSDALSLVLDIPTYGAVFMNTPDDPLRALDQDDPAATPRNDVVIRGELVITMPASLGRRRIKGIKVGIRSILTLDLRPGRMNEVDTLFERSVELGECSACTMILEPGTTIFDFTLIIPANHPPHDWHNNGTLRHFLYAEIEGMGKSGKGKDAGVGFLGFRSRSYGREGKGDGHKSPRSGHASPSRTPRLLSPVGSRSSSPARRDSYGRGLDAALSHQAGRMRLEDGQVAQVALGQAPAYDEAGSGARTPPTPGVSTTPEEWLKGTYKTERTLMLVYNPSPEGEVTVLDLHFNGMAEGLGIWDVTLTSNPVTPLQLVQIRPGLTCSGRYAPFSNAISTLHPCPPRRRCTASGYRFCRHTLSHHRGTTRRQRHRSSPRARSWSASKGGGRQANIHSPNETGRRCGAALRRAEGMPRIWTSRSRGDCRMTIRADRQRYQGMSCRHRRGPVSRADHAA